MAKLAYHRADPLSAQRTNRARWPNRGRKLKKLIVHNPVRLSRLARLGPSLGQGAGPFFAMGGVALARAGVSGGRVAR